MYTEIEDPGSNIANFEYVCCEKYKKNCKLKEKARRVIWSFPSDAMVLKCSRYCKSIED